MNKLWIHVGKLDLVLAANKSIPKLEGFISEICDTIYRKGVRVLPKPYLSY